MTRVFRVADVFTDCSTRERGRKVYPALADLFRSARAAGEELVISFESVDLVTPSFLDETIVRLVREEPMGQIALTGIRDFPVQSFHRMLRATSKGFDVQQEAAGVYRLTAVA